LEIFDSFNFRIMNIGKLITHGYCNGFFGRDSHDLDGCVIEAEGYDWIVIRKAGELPRFAYFAKGFDKQAFIDKWCLPIED
jgi:hypothetical protein